MREDGKRVMRVDVALTPGELATESANLSAGVAIVVDVIRATTTLSVLFDRGCRRVLLAPTIDAARAAKATRPDALLAGEVGGAAPLGFDLGNSPSDISLRDVAGRDVVFATTNGTRALRACAFASVTFAGSLRSATATAHAALASLERGIRGGAPPDSNGNARGATPREEAPSEAPLNDGATDILVVCAGREGRPAYDDTVCAGYLCRTIIELASATGETPRLGEGARVALATLRGAEVTGLRGALAESDAARAIAAIELGDDLDWCVALDASRSAPQVVGREETDLLVMEPWRPETG